MMASPGSSLNPGGGGANLAIQDLLAHLKDIFSDEELSVELKDLKEPVPDRTQTIFFKLLVGEKSKFNSYPLRLIMSFLPP